MFAAEKDQIPPENFVFVRCNSEPVVAAHSKFLISPKKTKRINLFDNEPPVTLDYSLTGLEFIRENGEIDFEVMITVLEIGQNEAQKDYKVFRGPNAALEFKSYLSIIYTLFKDHKSHVLTIKNSKSYTDIERDILSWKALLPKNTATSN